MAPGSSPLYPSVGEEVPRTHGPLAAALGRFMMRLGGWSFEGSVPNEAKMVLIVAPHTSNWDFPIGLWAKFAMQLKASFLGKHTFVLVAVRRFSAFDRRRRGRAFECGGGRRRLGARLRGERSIGARRRAGRDAPPVGEVEVGLLPDRRGGRSPPSSSSPSTTLGGRFVSVRSSTPPATTRRTFPRSGPTTIAPWRCTLRTTPEPRCGLSLSRWRRPRFETRSRPGPADPRPSCRAPRRRRPGPFSSGCAPTGS